MGPAYPKYIGEKDLKLALYFPNAIRKKNIFLFVRNLYTICLHTGVRLLLWHGSFYFLFFCNLTFRMYQDKLAQLKKQLTQLKDGTLPEYMKKMKKIDQQYKERLRINEIWYQYEVCFLWDLVYITRSNYFPLVFSDLTFIIAGMGQNFGKLKKLPPPVINVRSLLKGNL